MNIFKLSGVAVGVIVGLILVVVLYKLANTNHKTRTEYDERQKELRGRAYMYAFYTMLVFECVMMALGFAEVTLPVDAYLVHFTGIVISCMVLACYCIWHDVYWGLNNDPKRYIFVFAVLIVLNAVPVVRTLMEGTMIEDGKISSVAVNLIVLVMMLVLIVLLFIKGRMDQNAGQEE